MPVHVLYRSVRSPIARTLLVCAKFGAMASAHNVNVDKSLPVPQKLLINLKKLECPLLKDEDDWWIQNVLFSTPEYHVEFLHWILVRFNKELHVSLDENCKFKDCSLEVKIEKLVGACTSLGLWEGLDERIVKCAASGQELFQFWEFLVDLFLVKQSCIEYSENLGESYLNNRSETKKTLGSLYADACQSLENAAKQSQHPNFFPTGAPLFHPEIENALKRFTESLNEKDSKLTPPGMDELKKMHEEVNKNLGQECDTVSFYSKKGDLEYTPSEGLAASTEQRLHKLEDDLFTTESHLRNLIQEFDKFHSHIKMQLGRKQDNLSELGVKYHMAYEKLQKFIEVQEKFSLIKDSYAKLKSLKNELTVSDVKTFLPSFFDDIHVTEKKLRMLERILEN